MYREKLGGWLKHYDFVLLDILMVQISFLLAYAFRHGMGLTLASNNYRLGALILFIGTPLTAILLNAHKDILKRGHLQEAYAVIKIVGTLAILLIVVLYMAHIGGTFSRLVVGYFAIIATMLMYLEHIAWKRILISRNKAGSNRKVLLVTTKNEGKRIIPRLLNDSYGTIEITGIIAYNDSLKVGEELYWIPVVARLENVEEYLLTKWVDSVLIFLPRRAEEPEAFLKLCVDMGITTQRHINLETPRPVMTAVERIGDYAMLTESIKVASTRDMFFKRLIDISGGIIGMIITIILTIIVGPFIFFADPGNIFFSQTRIGRNGKPFKIYKFRSMYKDAEARKKDLMDQNEMQGNMFKMEHDPRILGSGPDGTRHGIGWFIRKFSIDEFPQFYNVLIGDMSLCGTRPPLESEVQEYKAHHRARLAMRPGITGLWQVSGRSDITDFEEVVALDMEYINNWSISEDFKLIFRTVGVLFKGDGAK